MYKLSNKAKTTVIKQTKDFVVRLLIFMLLIGLVYIILYPFIFKILAAFMSQDDLSNPLVDIVPMDWSLDNIFYVLENGGYIEAFKNTILYGVLSAFLVTATASLVGYGISKFKFKGVNLVTFLIILIMLMPIQTLSIPIYLNFRYFDLSGLFSLFGSEGINLVDTIWPTIIMSATGFSFRAGVFIILMRQYYTGVPNELIEAACVDGAGVFKTFFSIILPMAKSMLIVVFSLSFAWQYTDTFYSNLLYPSVKTLPSITSLLSISKLETADYYLNFVRGNTAQILAIFPLVIFYCILQKRIIQGIERSGLVG